MALAYKSKFSRQKCLGGFKLYVPLAQMMHEAVVFLADVVLLLLSKS